MSCLKWLPVNCLRSAETISALGNAAGRDLNPRPPPWQGGRGPCGNRNLAESREHGGPGLANDEAGHVHLLELRLGTDQERSRYAHLGRRAARRGLPSGVVWSGDARYCGENSTALLGVHSHIGVSILRGTNRSS